VNAVRTPTGDWGNLPLTTEHAAYLETQAAITPETAERVGIRSITSVEDLPTGLRVWGERAIPSIAFTWRSADGRVVEQLKPDVKFTIEGEDRERKYLWPAGQAPIVNCTRADAKATQVLLVEGTKQSLAAASYAPQGWAVYGVAGCRSWSRDGVPDIDLSLFEGKEVVVCLDADASSNRSVYDAGEALAQALRAEGVTAVRFIHLPGGTTVGLDDLLVRRPAETRTTYIGRLIEGAHRKPATRKPTARQGRSSDLAPDDPARFFNDEIGLLTQQLSVAVRAIYPAALTVEDHIALYSRGVFQTDGAAFSGAVARLLGDRFRPNHRAAVEEFTMGILKEEGIRLPIHCDEPVLNVRNGMLDLMTGTLKPHDPSYLSSMQIPVEWDENAQCPVYCDWIVDRIGDQVDDLEEVAGTMLDPSRTPPKAVFLFGPSRSGKSTFLRLMQYMVGVENYSAETLQRLSENRFAAANVFGRMLNCAADLSSAHVEDISMFKLMTGEDPIAADRKYGRQFAFTNRALFAFSANELPTVGESSKAYTERIKPFEFAKSFAGAENPEIERAMLNELPGILVRWVRAWQRMRDRGRYLPTSARVQREFEIRSDRVKQWMTECVTVHAEDADGKPAGPGAVFSSKQTTTKARLVEAFNAWAEKQGGSKMGARKIVERVMNVEGVFEVRAMPSKARALNVTIRTDGGDVWEDDTDPVAVSEALVAVPGGPVATSVAVSDRADAQVSGTEPSPVAEVATLDPTVALTEKNTTRRTPFKTTEGDGDTCFPGVETVGLETATSATSPVEYEHLDPAEFALAATQPISEGVVVFDIEGASVEEVYTAGPEFVKLFGYQTVDQLRVTEQVHEMVELIQGARVIVGHNIMNLDLIPFVRHHGLDLHQAAEDGRLWDTQLVEVLLNPPPFWMKPSQVPAQYSLDKLALEKFEVGKSHDLRALVKKHGGKVMPKGKWGSEFSVIPNDDKEYVTYCASDVDITARIALTQRATPAQRDYIKREHRIAAIATQISMNGFKVDQELLRERIEQGNVKKAQLRERLIDLGATFVKKDGTAAKVLTDTDRLVIEGLFAELGVELPRTPTGNAPSLRKETLEELTKEHADRPEVVELIQTVGQFNGVRTVYQTALDNLHPDGRVHPNINMYQSTGRWSVKDPGMTVFGKRGGRHIEREIFVPDEGEVIISADLSQVDARAIAAWSQCPDYMRMFDPGMDIHAEVALQMFGDRGRRDDAKALSHGYNYGLGFNKLAKAHGEELARTFLDTMRDSFPRLVEWKDEIRRESEANGFRLDNGWGKPLVIDPQSNYTQAPALVGQSAARDIMMQGLLNLPRWVLPMLRVQVHDEIVLSVPEDRVDEIKAIVVDALSFPWRPFNGERGHTLTVEILADSGKHGVNWGAVYAK